MYRDEKGVPRDYKEAVRWYRKATEQGYGNAQYELGLMYRKGKGVLKDVVMAHKWWNIASVSGHKKAIAERGVAENKMTPSQIQEATRLAREWMEKHRKK